MKKVINITLGSIVFAIEQDAFEALSVYLDAIVKNLSGNDDKSEISSDIEGALAEKFLARKRGLEAAVTLADVEAVTLEMGNPAEFGQGAPSASEASTHTADNEAKRRLYRDTDDVIISGVASGLARFFDIDPVIVRLVFVASIFFGGFGVFVYLVLWLVVPQAETLTQKYAMRGEKITLKEITDRVKNLNNIESVKGLWGGVRDFLQKLFSIMGQVARMFVRMLRVVVGFCLIFLGALGIVGLVSGTSVLWFSKEGWTDPHVQSVANALLSDTSGYVFTSALFVAIFIPLLTSILLGVGLLVRKNFFSIAKVITFGVVWVVALSVMITLSVIFGPSVVHELEGLDVLPEGTTVEIEGLPA